MRTHIVSAIFAAALFLAASGHAEAQTPVSDGAAVLSRIDAANAGIRSLSGRFSQTRKSSMVEETMKSEGRICVLDGKVRWEYTSPQPSVCIIDGEEVTLFAGGQVRQMGATASRGFQGIAKIFSSAGSLSSGKDFSAEIFEAGKGWMVVLVPKGRDLRRMFSSVRLFFGEDLHPARIELIEASGDRTVISLSGMVYNGEVSPFEFELP